MFREYIDNKNVLKFVSDWKYFSFFFVYSLNFEDADKNNEKGKILTGSACLAQIVMRISPCSFSRQFLFCFSSGKKKKNAMMLHHVLVKRQ